MNSNTFLDTLDDFLTERDEAFTALSRARLLLARFKLNCGAEGSELLAGQLFTFTEPEESTTVRQRTKRIGSGNNKKKSGEGRRLLSRAEQVNELRAVFSGVLHNKLIPLAELQAKLEGRLN